MDGKTTVLKDLEERVRKYGHTSAIESAADDIVALKFELEQLQDENERLKERINGYSGAAVFDGDL